MRAVRITFPRLTASLVLALPIVACARGAPVETIVASGHVEATEVRVSTKVPGRVEAVERAEGDRTAAGEVLARIDTTDVRLALDQVRADRALAQAELDLRVAGARREDVAELEAQVASAEADAEGSQRDLDRMQGLFDRGSGAEKGRDDARTRRDMAAARLAAVRQALARARAGSRPEELRAARARLEAATARLALLEQQERDAVVTSPVAGVVTARLVEPGELVPAGGAIAVVTALDDPWLTVYVGEPDVPRIRIGQTAEVVTDDGQRSTGKVTFVASKAEFTPKNVQTRDERVKLVFKIKIGLDNPDGLFKPGMPAEATFARAENE